MKNLKNLLLTFGLLGLLTVSCDETGGPATDKNAVVYKNEKLVFLNPSGTEIDLTDGAALRSSSGGGLGIVILGDTSLVAECDDRNLEVVYTGPAATTVLAMVNDSTLGIYEAGALMKSLNMDVCTCIKPKLVQGDSDAGMTLEIRVSQACIESAQ